MSDTPESPKLLDLATARFGTLSPAEEKLFIATPNGEEVDCMSLVEFGRKIRTDCLIWLCTSQSGVAHVTYRGISILGGIFEEEVNLSWVKVPFQLRMRKCIFRKALLLENSHVAQLDLAGTAVRKLNASRLTVDGSIFLSDGFKCQEGVDLVQSTIGNDLRCDNGHFISSGEVAAFDALWSKIGGGLYFLNSEATGQVCLAGVTIVQQFLCTGCQFVGRTGTSALDASMADIGGRVIVDSLFEGQVVFAGARIRGFLTCRGQMRCEGDHALDLSSIEVLNNVAFPDFLAVGGISLIGATIGAGLLCFGSQLVGAKKGPALNATCLKLNGDAYFQDGFKADGGVNFWGAEIKGSLICGKSTMIGYDQNSAFGGPFLKVAGNVAFLDGSIADGGLNLGNAEINGSVACLGCELIGNAKKSALELIDSKISGNVHLGYETVIDGAVSLSCAVVTHDFIFSDLKSPEKWSLDLQLARVGSLLNYQNSWPSYGQLWLNDFVFDHTLVQRNEAVQERRREANIQLEWLHRQSRELFSNQPYEQVASVLRRSGLPEEARLVLIKKNEDYAHRLPRGSAWLWYGFFGKLIGYGYRPLRAFCISLALIFLGWFFFDVGYKSGVIVPTDEKAYTFQRNGLLQVSSSYPKFNSFIYSLERFVPIFKFGLADRWTPDANRVAPVRVRWLAVFDFPMVHGNVLRYYLWFHIIAGWVLTSLWVGALTGLLKS